MKKLFSVTLAVLLLMALVSACNSSPPASIPGTSPSPSASQSADPSSEPTVDPSENPWPDYLNLDSTFPIIKYGEGEDIVLRVASYDTTGLKWDDLWLAKYIAEDMNITIEMERILAAALVERKNLMFMSNAMPDIMMNLAFTTIELVKYGQMENQLLPLEDYIDPVLTPDIYHWFNEIDNTFALSTLPDGHIYALPNLNPAEDEGSIPRVFFDMTDLEAVGLGLPQTLDEFVSTMLTLKAEDPKGIGSENYFPIANGLDQLSAPFGHYILNGLGYVTPSYNTFGLAPTVRNGALEFASENPETFGEYLRILNLFYEEGVLAPDFLSMDGTTASAYMLNGQSSFFGNLNPDGNFTEWQAGYPLTGAYNDKRVWYGVNHMGAQYGFVVSAETQYAELCMRFANAWYSEESVKLWYGAPDGHEQAKGYLGPTWDAEKKDVVWDNTKFPEDSVGLVGYLLNHVTLYPTFGCMAPSAHTFYRTQLLDGDPMPVEKVFNLTTVEGHYRNSVTEHLMPYRSEHFPTIFYLDDATNTKLTDITAVIDPYSKEQVALFISGGRPLDQVPDYINELKGIGFDEYRAIYQKIWDDYKAAS